jgi:hypothetical protein
MRYVNPVTAEEKKRFKNRLNALSWGDLCISFGVPKPADIYNHYNIYIMKHVLNERFGWDIEECNRHLNPLNTSYQVWIDNGRGCMDCPYFDSGWTLKWLALYGLMLLEMPKTSLVIEPEVQPMDTSELDLV